MTLSVSVPTAEEPLVFNLSQNQNTLFVLGANGTGKSALLHHIHQQHQEHAYKVAAYRQTWFASGTPDMSGTQYKKATTNLRGWDAKPQSRYVESQSGYSRTSRILAALMNKQRERDRKATALLDRGKNKKAKQYVKDHRDPLDIINGLFEASNLGVQVFIGSDDPDTIFARHVKTGNSYTVEKLSDGERSALLLASEVLTAKEGTVFLLDEPERHLHRSIISPLLSALFRTRSDCYFVISTHEVLLPEDCEPASSLILRGCEFDINGVANRWDADVVPSDVELDEDIKADIWGARRKLVYVEGKMLGADERLYSAIFPEATVKAKDSCEQVINSVRAARSASVLHWLDVYGLVDGDTRSSQEIAELKADGIFVLPLRAVESLYYGKKIREVLARRQAEHEGLAPEDYFTRARRAVLDNASSLKRLTPDEQSTLSGMVAAQDTDGIVAAYPIGRSAIPNEIAKRLGYTDKKRYQRAARALVRNDDEVRRRVAGACGDIAGVL